MKIRKILDGAVGASALAGTALALAPSAFAATIHKSDSATGLVNNSGYTGTYNHINTTNSQWNTDNYSLFVTGSYGWTNTFTFQVQTSVSGNHSAQVVTGSVTDTTEYGSSTQTFTVPAAQWIAHPQVPFGVDKTTGQITADNGNWYGIFYASDGTLPVPVSQVSQSNDPAGWYMFNAEYNMVYSPAAGAQNAGYWFGNLDRKHGPSGSVRFGEPARRLSVLTVVSPQLGLHPAP